MYYNVCNRSKELGVKRIQGSKIRSKEKSGVNRNQKSKEKSRVVRIQDQRRLLGVLCIGH